ncbi:MAG: trans-aconitate 2-methyltransferase [Rhizobiaceae bacterium]|nr:trans-aconitate 2-methyltransferase [Rhizobiaceae bacterium]
MAWSARQYVKFEDERTRPPRDLLAQVPLEHISRAVDLGCGPGNSTELLIERFGAAHVSGIDSDDDMLAAARVRLPYTSFTKADLATWRPDAPHDLFFANAVFQWLPEHMTIFERLMGHLRPGGVLAVQMPDNLDEPSHRAMRDTAADGPWAFRFAEPAVRRTVLPAPSVYYDRLKPHAARIDIWHTIYNHPMADHGAIVEWVKGSGLRPWLDRAGPDHRDGFLAAYRRRIEEAYPVLAGGGVLFRFPRLFIVAAR